MRSLLLLGFCLLSFSASANSQETERYNVWHSAIDNKNIQCLKKNRGDEIIYLKGHIKLEDESLIQAGNIIAKLPPICIPSERVSLYIHIDTSNNLSSVSILSISPKGDIIYEQGRNMTSQDTGIILNGINFSR